jgi:catechol 2,3-dioxygenase-like lactoylglutathione lyase family enzyme
MIATAYNLRTLEDLIQSSAGDPIMQIVLQHISVPRPPGEGSAQLARQFYTGLLGLTEKPVPSTIVHLDLVWFKIGEETELHVFAEKDSDTTSGRHFCLNVSNVNAMREALIKGGFQPWSPEEIQGRPRFFCRDPFDNIIEFTQIMDDYMKYQ